MTPDSDHRQIEGYDTPDAASHLALGVTLTEVVSPAPREDWFDIWSSDPFALPTQGPDWMLAATSLGPYRDSSRFYRFSDGVRAVLPLFSRPGVPAILQYLASPPPAWGYGGLVSDRPLMLAHYAIVVADLRKRNALQVSIRPNPFSSDCWKSAGGRGSLSLHKRAHVLELSQDFDTIRAKRFSSNARRHLKTAQAAGLEVVTGHDPEIIREFHGLLMQSLDRWAAQQGEPALLARLRGTRRDPLEKFLAIARTIGPQMKIYLARLDQRPAAAIIVLFGRNAHYTRGAMDKALAGPTAANYLLHATAIEEACRRGCGTYNMGETGQSKSLADFKEKFGAVGVDYSEFRLERLPITRIDSLLRTTVKRLLGMKDA
jgi:hypothetical protein